jgi:multisubunit Na+/H+ antiporter MnhC subunit
VLQAIRRVLVGTGSTAFTLIGAVVIGFGVPLFWIFVASRLYDKTGAVSGPVAVFIFTGIIVSYWGLLLLASWIRARTGAGRREAEQYNRAAWNRSLRDDRHLPGQSRHSDPIERLFVATAILCIIGFVLWFAFFAGAPLPT